MVDGSVQYSKTSFSECQGSYLLLLLSITVKDVKALLPQVNYRVPNMRFLKDKLQVRRRVATILLDVLASMDRGHSLPFFLFFFLLLLPRVWKEVEARSDLSYPHFTQLYRTLMFDAQKSVSGTTSLRIVYMQEAKEYP